MTIIFFILGLIIGSFLNVVVLRLEQAETLLGRSHCPKCRRQVRWHDNIPLVSFILLSARCRDCGENISWQYPIMELMTGVVFALIGHYFFDLFVATSWLQTAAYLTVFSLFLVIFLYDLKFMEIPMHILWLAVGVMLAYVLLADWQAYVPAMELFELRTFSGLLAGGLAFVFFFSLAFFSKERWMGYGDAYVGLLSGLIVGWPSIFIALILSFTIGALISVCLVALKSKTMKSQVPFAPFLVAGTFLTLILPRMFPSVEYLFSYF